MLTRWKRLMRTILLLRRFLLPGATRAACLVWLVAGASFSWGEPIAGEEPSVLEIDAVMAAMAAQRSEFDASGLHALGLEGLSAVLDRLLPDTARPTSPDVADETAERIIARLGDDRFLVRESATRELIELGRAVRPRLIEAARHTDAEVSWRARSILRKWEIEVKEDKSRFVAGFEAYCEGIQDERRIEELGERARRVLEGGAADGARRQIVTACMAAVARHGDDRYTDQFRPLLKHEDVQVPVLVVRAIGAAVEGRDCPALLLDALGDDRRETVVEAMRWTPYCGEGPHRSDVRRVLIGLFEGDDEELRFQVSFPLMSVFDDPRAADYLLAQLASPDEQRRSQAFDWIGDAGNFGKPASAKLLDAVGPLLESPDHRIRRLALRTLSIYSGEEVVKRLIPMLADPNASIAGEVVPRLQHQRDKEMLRRVLSEAAENGDEKIRTKAAEVLEKLRQEG